MSDAVVYLSCSSLSLAAQTAEHSAGPLHPSFHPHDLAEHSARFIKQALSMSVGGDVKTYWYHEYSRPKACLWVQIAVTSSGNKYIQQLCGIDRSLFYDMNVWPVRCHTCPPVYTCDAGVHEVPMGCYVGCAGVY